MCLRHDMVTNLNPHIYLGLYLEFKDGSVCFRLLPKYAKSKLFMS